MKNYFISCSFALLFITINSCTKVDQQIFDASTSASVIKNSADVDNAIIGLYAQFNSWSGFKDQQFMIYPYADDLSSVAVNNLGTWGTKININSGVGNLSNVWNRYYKAISNANAVIGYANNITMTDSTRAKMIAEAKFVRGLSYFYLVQYFGAVPITTTVFNADSDMKPKRSSVDSVYQQIFADFAEGTTALPTRLAQPSKEFNRATRGAAFGFLSKAYLTYANYLDLNNRTSESNTYYGNARDYADSVISSNQYSLIADYAKLWDVTLEKNAYNEVIFGIAYTRDATVSDITSDGSNWPFIFNPQSRPNSGGNGANKVGGGQIRVHPWFYEKYTVGQYLKDYRTEVTFTTTWVNTTGKTVVTFPVIPPSGALSNESQPYINKYVDPNALNSQNSENDLFLLRLSEIYLIRAEAENEINGPSNALASFNKLRQRARNANGTSRTTPTDLTLTDVPTKEDMRMAIFDERGLELVAEFNRWFDLVRMRYKDNVRTMYEYQFGTFLPSLTPGKPTYTKSAGWSSGRTEETNIIPFERKYLLYPIPANEIGVNPYIGQNNGW